MQRRPRRAAAVLAEKAIRVCSRRSKIGVMQAPKDWQSAHRPRLAATFFRLVRDPLLQSLDVLAVVAQGRLPRLPERRGGRTPRR